MTTILWSIPIGIATSFIATALYIRRRGLIARFVRLGRPGPSLKHRAQRGWRPFRRSLSRWIVRDQTVDGIHRGEFGENASSVEEQEYQVVDESLNVKPRLYLTGWPCFVLRELGIKRRSVRLALSQLESGPVRVRQGVAENVSPTSQPSLISVRHTIRVAQIQLRVHDRIDNAIAVLGYMLDGQRGWQNEDGGWRSAESSYVSSDIWSTAYAACVLDQALVQPQLVPRLDIESCGSALRDTTAFLAARWEADGWAIARGSSEQNGLLVANEVIPTLMRTAPDLVDKIGERVRGWSTPTGTVSLGYLERCRGVTRASAAARLAYANYLLDRSAENWVPLLREAIFAFEEGLNAADASFVLQMAAEIQALHGSLAEVVK